MGIVIEFKSRSIDPSLLVSVNGKYYGKTYCKAVKRNRDYL